jgi:hypothetical protein
MSALQNIRLIQFRGVLLFLRLNFIQTQKHELLVHHQTINPMHPVS